MVDFNTKKNILKKLRKVRTENKLMWLPCVIAAAFVKLWYGTVCRIGMALSDRNGNFLGIKMSERKHDSRKVRRQDDIVYVKRPFFGRIMSAVLAAAFVAMFVPELGISFDVAADNGLPLEYKDPITGEVNIYQFWRDKTPGSNLVIYDGIYQAAAYYEGVTIHDPVKSYGYVKLSWEIAEAYYTDYNKQQVELTQYVSGYKIIINDQSGGELYNQSINNTNTSIRDFEVKLDYTSDMNIRIYPIFRVPAWTYLQGVPDPDNPGETKDDLTPPSTNTTFAPVESTRSKVKPLGKADAHFDAAKMAATLTDSEGKPTEEFYPDSIKDVNIEWQRPKMICDGVEAETYPDGYWVYLYDYTDNKLAAKSQIVVGGDSGTLSRSIRALFSRDLAYGHHYRIFIEAYKNIWGGSPSNYNVKNTGLVSSSLYAVDKSDKDIYSLYLSYPDDNSNLCQDLYVAPYVTFDKVDYTKSSITVSWKKDSSSTYTGVEIYRSTEDIQVSDLVDVLVKNGDNPGNVYGVKKVTEILNDKTLSYTDYDINMDTRYYYYIVPFITKTANDTNRIRGTAARDKGSLEFMLTTVRITYTTDNGKVKLQWTPSKTANNSYGNADGYKLEIFQKKRYNPDTKTFETVPADSKPIFSDNTFGPNDLSYNHDGLFNNEVYTYVVTPYVNVNPQSGPPKPFYGQPTSIDVTVGGLLGTPENVTAECTADGEVTIKWDRVPDATGYTISYTDEYNGEVVTGTLDSKTNTKVHKGLLLDHVITYEVTAYKTVTVLYESQTTYGEKSFPAKVKVGSTLARPQNLKTTTTDGTVNISWSPVSDAKGYLLQYKFTKKDGTSVEFVNNIAQIKNYVFDLTDAKYVHSGLQNGDRYTYRVLAYKDVSGETVYSPWSDESWVIVGVPLDAPKDFLGTTKDGVINLTWTAVKGAEGYELYFRKNGGSWEKIDVSKPGFQHTGLKNGDSYEYYVKAYKTVNGVRVYSDEVMSNHLYFTVGEVIDAPKDFTVTVNDGKADMKWTAVKGAEGYIIHASSGGRYYQFDVSKVTYTHSDLSNGDVWTYYVTAYKTVNGTRTYSNPSEPKTVTIGITLNSAVDLTATAGNRQIDLKWTAVKGAEGYVVYLYNSKTMEFEPITVTSKTNYSHVGLKNGKQYTYMVAPYKTINGKRFYGDYSLSVTAIPTTGSITDMDHELIVKGTAPYGISHSEYITAVSNHGAFDESVDVYFSTNRESTQAVRDVLKNYADGLSSFIIYPFDISIYRENTYIKVDPEDGYTVTITMPVPDRLIAYRDYITVVHIGDNDSEAEEISLANDWLENPNRKLEVLPCAIVDIDNVWCVQFKCSSFSPYALVIYKEHIQDVASGGGLLDDGFTDTFNSGLLLFTALPDIMPHNRKLKIVQSGSKRYKIKSVTKK